MKLKVQQIMDATLVVSRIIREDRPLPIRGKYLLARMHAKLLPEFTTIDTQRDGLITTYDHHPMTAGPDGVLEESKEFSVPEDKMPEFTALWKEIADQEVDIDLTPIPLAALDLGGESSIEAHELIVLGDLISE